MQFGLKSLLVTIAGLAVVVGWVVYFKSIDWTYTRLVSLNCGEGRTIHVYVQTFCDYADIPVFDVHLNGDVIAPKFVTRLWFECGDPPDPGRFRLVSDDSKSIFALMYGSNEIAAIFDFQTGVGIPGPNRDDDIPIEILERLHIQTQN